MTFAARLTDLRTRRALSRPALARLIQASPVDVWRWENTARLPDTPNLARLADALDTTTDYLLGRTDDPRTIVQLRADLMLCVATA